MGIGGHERVCLGFTRVYADVLEAALQVPGPLVLPPFLEDSLDVLCYTFCLS